MPTAYTSVPDISRRIQNKSSVIRIGESGKESPPTAEKKFPTLRWDQHVGSPGSSGVGQSVHSLFEIATERSSPTPS
ncbi:hypothetical protein TNCV_769521 [Trichonephila clavipes]|nr:hypothetical protein TNCV_769521 [Trichonephila clavipes]